MNTDKPYAAEIPATGSIKRAGTVMVILCAVLTMAWIVPHKKSHQPGPQTAAARAVSMCEQAVRRTASHPASVSFSEFGSQPPTKMQDGSYQDRMAFEEKDALGDSIAKEAICTVKDGKLQSFKEPKP